MVGSTLEKANLTENCVKLISGPNIDRKYLYYFLSSSIGQAEIARGAVGAVQPKLPIKNIQDINILLPSLQSQRRIAGILSAFDDKIELNNQINHNLEEQAQALYKSWFVDFEPFKDGEFVESKFGIIPKGWKIIPFKNFLSPVSRKVPVGIYPEYSVTNTGIVPRSEKFKKQLSGAMSQNKELRKYELVFGMSREILNWGIMLDEIGCVSSAYNIYSINESLINPLYLKYYISHRITYFNDLIGTAAREGQSLDKGALMQKEAIVPPPEIIASFLSKDNLNSARKFDDGRMSMSQRQGHGQTC